MVCANPTQLKPGADEPLRQRRRRSGRRPGTGPHHPAGWRGGKGGRIPAGRRRTARMRHGTAVRRCAIATPPTAARSRSADPGAARRCSGSGDRTRLGATIAFSVEDSGSGIAPDAVEHIFDPLLHDQGPWARASGLGLPGGHGQIVTGPRRAIVADRRPRVRAAGFRTSCSPALGAERGGAQPSQAPGPGRPARSAAARPPILVVSYERAPRCSTSCCHRLRRAGFCRGRHLRSGRGGAPARRPGNPGLLVRC